MPCLSLSTPQDPQPARFSSRRDLARSIIPMYPGWGVIVGAACYLNSGRIKGLEPTYAFTIMVGWMVWPWQFRLLHVHCCHALEVLVSTKHLY